VTEVTPGTFKPFAQSLYVDVVEQATAAPRPIHLGAGPKRRATTWSSTMAA
jgi:hypothetical protein